MSRTLRKNHLGQLYRDGQKHKDIVDEWLPYRCRCGYCTNEDKRKLEEKIVDREMKQEIKQKQ